MLNHVPFWDETHAFYISRLKLSEIFYLTKIEGHPILWYLILKPFSALNLYPWSMKIINWLFCIGAVVILWKKAPFSPILKTLITFSTPFVYFFAPIARCYSVGILLLFLICAFYKKRFCHPYLFASLIAISANTSIMVAIGAFYIGLIFLFDLFLKLKNKSYSKKKFYGVLGIFAACTLFLLLQFVGYRTPTLGDNEAFIARFINFVILPYSDVFLPFILHIFSSIAFYYFIFKSYKTSKRALFFALSTIITLTYIFYGMYSGSHWNHYFYFIYFIIFLWIFKKQMLTNKFSYFIVYAIFILFLTPKAVFESGKMEIIYASKVNRVTKEIIENPKLKNSKLYTIEWWSDVAPGALIYLAKNNINIYDIHNRNRLSFDSIKNIFALREEIIDLDEFIKNMDKNSYILDMGSTFKQKFSNLLVIPKENGDFILKTSKKTYILKEIENVKNIGLIIYKIIEN
ncbi:hypothetical protein IJX73_01355 [bacterium]|nr:hypothetical protein [bacterium]